MRLLDQVCEVLRKKHCSIRTEEACVEWIKRSVLFHGKRHPKDMKENEISNSFFFLPWIAQLGGG